MWDEQKMKAELLQELETLHRRIVELEGGEPKLKQAEGELNNYCEKMAHAELLASLITLSATVAHELSQSLTVIRLSIENVMAKLEAMSSPEIVTKKLKDSLIEVSNITSMVKKFRNFARESSENTLSKIDLGAIANRVVQLLHKSARRAKVTLHLKGMNRLPPIYSYEKDIEQLFFALAKNAIEAADSKKSRQLIISGAVRDEHIELRFSDNCGGIAPENLDEIFELFFTTKPAGEGNGSLRRGAHRIPSWRQSPHRKRTR